MTGTVLERLTQPVPSEGVTGLLRLQRAWPRGDDRLLLEYANGAGSTVAGQWHADRGRGEAIARATPGATWIADAGVVLQRDGADRRLPALARLLGEPGATLVVHRPERRAVVRRPGPTYVKVVRPERAPAVLAADEAARATRAVLMPRLLFADLDEGVLEWAELSGRALYDLLFDPRVSMLDLARAGTAAGRAVRALHDATPPPGMPVHRPSDEIEAATRWVQPARALSRVPPELDRALGTAAELLAQSPTPPVLVHRDLHEKQVLIEGDDAGLLDVDTLAAGEAAVDLANLLVHLDLRVALGLPAQRGRTVADAFLDAYQPTADVVARIPAYAASTCVRLTCVHAFRPAEIAGAARLVTDPRHTSSVRRPLLPDGASSAPRRAERRRAWPHGTMPHIAFALGKPPRPPSVVAAALDLLRKDGFEVTVHLLHDHPPQATPGWFLDVDLVVQRGLDHRALAALAPVEEAGIRCCNPIAATAALADRMLVHRRLQAAGVPVPRTEPATTWEEVRTVTSDGRPVVVKARDGRRGRGVQVLVATDGQLPLPSPFDGPYIVQDHLLGDGEDRKLYLAGSHVLALRKPGLGHPSHGRAGVSFQPTRTLARIGCGSGRALGLDIFGVDVIVGPAGPHVVDINPFPGFRGVPKAAGLIAREVAGIALRGAKAG